MDWTAHKYLKPFALALCNQIFFCLVSVHYDCAAQALPTELEQRIERQLRVTENIPDAMQMEISFPHDSELPNYDAITVTLKGDQETLNKEYLLSKDRKALVRLTRIDLRNDPYAAAMKRINLKGRPVRGNPTARIVAVSYIDFQCPFCARVHQTLFPELLKEYGDRVAFVYRDFPLSDIHPWATRAAVNANCLASQSTDAYWDFADIIHSNQRAVNSQEDSDGQFRMLDRITVMEAAKVGLDATALQACLNSRDEGVIKESLKEGGSLGVSSTPVMFVNGEMINGARPASAFRAALDRAMQDVEQSPLATPSERVHPRASSGPPARDYAAHADQR